MKINQRLNQVHQTTVHKDLAQNIVPWSYLIYHQNKFQASGIHVIDRRKQDASWKKLGDVKKEQSCFEWKNAWSRFALVLFKLPKIW